MEGDTVIARKVAAISDKSKVKAFTETNKNGSLYTSDCKFAWIEGLLSDTVTNTKKGSHILSKFDRTAISGRLGKAVAVGIVLLGIVGSMVVAMPIMGIGGMIPSLLNPLLKSIGLPAVLGSFISNTIITALGWVVFMAGFVFGVNFVFGLIEEVGYMARISYVFDNTMNRLGLQGNQLCLCWSALDVPLVVRRVLVSLIPGDRRYSPLRWHGRFLVEQPLL